MGDASSSFVPFQINYINETKPVVNGFRPMNPPVTPCSQAVDVRMPNFYDLKLRDLRKLLNFITHKPLNENDYKI